jgi:cytosine/adenosine deaminase-related metal-dependent hydrolase
MRLAMRLHGTPILGEPAPDAEDIFSMATTGGAKLMRHEGRLGRIASGHAADLVLINLERVTWPWIAPEADPKNIVLYRARAGDVDTVLVAGEVVLRGGMPTRFDLQEVGRELAERLDAAPFPEAGAEMVEQLLPHLEAWYKQWPVPDLNPWIKYNSSQ